MFNLRIDTQCSAFDEDCPGELARMLRKVARIVANTMPGAGSFSIRDKNGNTVGCCTLED